MVKMRQSLVWAMDETRLIETVCDEGNPLRQEGLVKSSYWISKTALILTAGRIKLSRTIHPMHENSKSQMDYYLKFEIDTYARARKSRTSKV